MRIPIAGRHGARMLELEVCRTDEESLWSLSLS